MRLVNLLFFAMTACSASAFTTPAVMTMTPRPAVALRMVPPELPSEDVGATSPSPQNDLWKSATAAVMPILLAATPANAAGPDWGIFEGRTGSLLHPIFMGGLLLYSIYTATLGFQWRRQRTLGGEISALQKQLPSGIKTVADVKAAMSSKDDEESSISASQLQAALPVAQQIEEMQAERKELSAKAPRDQHFSQGALLAFIGTFFAIEGPLNTYARAGKLFPGPHLYAGAGLVVLWALAVATIPAMQKGSDTARTIHIGANVAGLSLFAWQVTTGIPILLKVWEFTKWP